MKICISARNNISLGDVVSKNHSLLAKVNANLPHKDFQSLWGCCIRHIIFLLFFSLSTSHAQIYWASAIKSCSVENKGGSFSPQKALGQPDVTPQNKPQSEAWTVQFPENQPEVSIELLFDEAVKVKTIYIAENLGIGIKTVILKDAEGNEKDEYTLNENYDLRLDSKAKISHIILYKPTNYLVKSLLITIQPPFIGRFCQIDGVGIAEKDIPLDYEEVAGKLQLPAVFKKPVLPLVKNTKQGRTLAEVKNQPTFFVNREVSRYTLNGRLVVENDKIGSIKIKLKNLQNQDTLVLTTEKDGSFQIGLDDAEYSIIGFQEGYLATHVSKIATQGKKIGEVINLNLAIREFKMGENYLFYEPIFDVNSDTLDNRSYQALQQLALTLKENPKAVVRIEVHSDSRGDDQYNLLLTAKRAEKIVSYLQRYGIDRRRLIGEGLGETELRNHCTNGVRCDNAAHLENRRIEIEIVELLK